MRKLLFAALVAAWVLSGCDDSSSSSDNHHAPTHNHTIPTTEGDAISFTEHDTLYRTAMDPQSGEFEFEVGVQGGFPLDGSARNYAVSVLLVPEGRQGRMIFEKECDALNNFCGGEFAIRCDASAPWSAGEHEFGAQLSCFLDDQEGMLSAWPLEEGVSYEVVAIKCLTDLSCQTSDPIVTLDWYHLQ